MSNILVQIFSFFSYHNGFNNCQLSKLVSLHNHHYYLKKLCCEFLSISSPSLCIVEACRRNSPFFLLLLHTPFLINFLTILSSWSFQGNHYLQLSIIKINSHFPLTRLRHIFSDKPILSYNS